MMKKNIKEQTEIIFRETPLPKFSLYKKLDKETRKNRLIQGFYKDLFFLFLTL